ncbi:hypothetical protein H0H81_003089 [Sphagnurus paluster]|uniref:Uncharacterized protein n=1 Tax=Sphagnurus paluster TaxID=117069 RepID=A0A9P7FRQ0_9AGAR|nr:hypothetical protein H0H81_003089 [Sphagnurus paluster]
MATTAATQAPAAKKHGGCPKKTPENQTSIQAPQEQTVNPIIDPSITTMHSEEDKDKEIECLRALLAAGQNTPVPATGGAAAINPITRPKGKAGNKKNGFILKDAMQLNGSCDKRAMYAAIVSHAEFPHLTKKCFPGDWASAEIIKQYLQNQCKSTRHKLKQLSAPHINDFENDKEDGQESSDGLGSDDA